MLHSKDDNFHYHYLIYIPVYKISYKCPLYWVIKKHTSLFRSERNVGYSTCPCLLVLHIPLRIYLQNNFIKVFVHLSVQNITSNQIWKIRINKLILSVGMRLQWFNWDVASRRTNNLITITWNMVYKYISRTKNNNITSSCWWKYLMKEKWNKK